MQVETKVKAINCLHFINGQFVESQNKKTFENINPATERSIRNSCRRREGRSRLCSGRSLAEH